MRFIARAKQRPSIPVVPLIDILCILLIFFIVTTTFKKPGPSVSIDLPKAGGLASASSGMARTTLAVTKSGELRLGDRVVAKEELASALAALKASQPDAKLELKADSQTSLQIMLDIWDALRAANIPIKEVPVNVRLEAKP